MDGRELDRNEWIVAGAMGSWMRLLEGPWNGNVVTG